MCVCVVVGTAVVLLLLGHACFLLLLLLLLSSRVFSYILDLSWPNAPINQYEITAIMQTFEVKTFVDS